MSQSSLVCFWNGNGPNVTSLANEVDNRPVLFSPLKVIDGQFGSLATTKATTQQHGQKRPIALTFQRLSIWKLPECTGLFGRQPVTQPHTQFFCTLDATYSSSELGAHQAAVSRFVRESAHSGESHVNCSGRQLASLEVNSITGHDSLAEGQPGFGAVPAAKLVDGVLFGSALL